jgi:hypothetical protein
MKDREPNELTDQSKSPNLEEGDIFMDKGNSELNNPSGTSEPQAQQENLPVAPLAETGSVPELHSPINQTLDGGNALRPAASEEESEDDIQARSLQRQAATSRYFGPAIQTIISDATDTLVAQGASRAEAAPLAAKMAESSLPFQQVDQQIVGRDRQRKKERKGQIGVPNSLEDLAGLIMKSSDPEWSHERSLVNEDGTVNTVNFLAWSRNNILRVHEMNGTSQVNFFNDIGTGVRNDVYGSQISFYEIVFTDSIFLQKVMGEVEIEDENHEKHTVLGEVGKKKNEDYEALRQQMMSEVYIFSLFRNPDLAYLMSRGQEETMLKAVTEAFAVSPLTRGDYLQTLFSLPSMHRQSLNDLTTENGRQMRAKQEGNYYMGDAFRDALSTYINVYDYDQLVKILGADAPIFRKTREDWDTAKGIRKTNSDGSGKDFAIPTDPEGKVKRDEWFDENGRVRLKRNPRTGRMEPDKKYMAYLNIFLKANPEQEQQSEVRLRLVLSIMQKNGISFREAQLAEAMAYSMTHTHGIAADNDQDALAFDYQTRLSRSLLYRLRQRAKPGSPYGGKWNLYGIKKTALNFFEAAKDMKERSVRTLIQGGAGRDSDWEAGRNSIKNTIEPARHANKNLVFKRGEETELDLGVASYEIIPHEKEIAVEGVTKKVPGWRMVYKDARGQEVNVGNAVLVTKLTEATDKIRFKADLQKQFVPNHLMTGTGLYKFAMEQVGFNLPDLVTGYDARGNPILDRKKLIELEKAVIHDVRYSLSTWSEIKYGEVDVRWEKWEVRNDKGRLVDEDGNELNEDWYILDKKGHKTPRRSSPETFIQSREVSVLESMFGIDALKHIQFEIEQQGLGAKPGEERKFITAKDDKGREFQVDITHADSSEFKTAVWFGAMDYYVAADIAMHRDHASGVKYYNVNDIVKARDALVYGEMITADRVANIRKETKTNPWRIWSQDSAFGASTGFLAGFLRATQAALKQPLF